MSQKLVDRSLDLKRLRDEGYDIHVRDGHLLVRSIPYLNADRQIKSGMMVSALELQNDATKSPIPDHTVWFGEERPCDKNGNPLSVIITDDRRTPVPGVQVQFQFSSKPTKGYTDYHEKMTTYIKMLVHQAQAIDPSVTAKVFPVIATDEDDESPFLYVDTASSRAGITVLSRKLAVPRIAIVGLGGTGSYVLDLVAKCPVRETHLYDDDTFSQHNAFRCPGAVGLDDMAEGLTKLEHCQRLYSRMRTGIVPHPYRITPENAHELGDMQFVFLCIDSGELKDGIMTVLEQRGIAFADVGMGVHLRDDALTGILRVTTSTPGMRTHVREHHRVSFSPARGDNLYDRNIQVAELNALNASLAVVKWKKYCHFYHDLKREHHSTYVVEMNKLSSEDRCADDSST